MKKQQTLRKDKHTKEEGENSETEGKRWLWLLAEGQKEDLNAEKFQMPCFSESRGSSGV